MAVIVSDMSEVNIDAALVENAVHLDRGKRSGGDEQRLHLLHAARRPAGSA